MTAINNIKISSNNSAIDGLKSKKMIQALKVSLIHWRLVNKHQRKSKKIENNSKDDKKKNLKEENPITLKKMKTAIKKKKR